MIQLDQVSKIYGAQHAVDALSFQVGKGEIVGFLGPNGAGKSTTMRMIMGFICLLYTSPSPRDPVSSRMPSSA